MTTILLTGGLGYIGSHIAVELLNSKEYYKIIIIDNLSKSSINMVKTILQNKTNNMNSLHFQEMDMTNYNDLDNLFREYKIDIVIHLAGLKSVGESIKNPIHYYQHNMISTINLIKVMNIFHCKNLVFSSSSTVYGNANTPYKETSPTGIGITNPYGRSKYMQEQILKDLYKSDPSWNIVILRYFNPISQKNISLKEKSNGIPSNLFPYLVKVHTGELNILNIYGNNYNTPDGTCVRDFIHVQDLANGHIEVCTFLLKNKVGLKIYNLGTGKGVSVKELITAFEKNNNTIINHHFTERRPGDLEISYADVSLIYNELGWKTLYSIEDMVTLM
jgi:UDP-glucose 4-epimerase